MNDPQTELEEILSEPIDVAQQRERGAFDGLARPMSPDRLVLFGAGRLGRRTLEGLRTLGITPLAFADNDERAWGRTIDGVSVLSPEDAARRYGDSAVFVVTIWGGGGARHRQRHTAEQLTAMGCARVVSVGHLYWKYASTFLPFYALDLPSRLLAHHEAIRRAMALWSDDASRTEFTAQIRWRSRLDFDGLPGAVGGEQYFPEDLLRVGDDEVFVDCGAFDGDTIRALLRLSGGRCGHVYALEPDPANLARLVQYRDTLSSDLQARVEIVPLAASSRRETLRFASGGQTSSALSATGDISIDCAPLDELIRRPVSFLKMDIEGAELEALRGATDTIRRSTPVLAIAAYHQQDHVWAIPLHVASLVSPGSYQYYLRPYWEEVWDLDFYAIPAARAVHASR